METRSKKKRTKAKKQENKKSNSNEWINRLVETFLSEDLKMNKLQIKQKDNSRKRTKTKKKENAVLNDDKNTNGLMIANTYIPEELLIEIFYHVDRETLLACQLVCKHWQFLIQHSVWHKKAEQAVGRTLLFDQRTPWMAYYNISAKMPFNKNLIKNHSGEKGLHKHWNLPPIKGIKWFIESPPVPPLPNDPSFNVKDHCYVTSYGMTWKYQIIDLIKEGFTEYLLDHLQPTIKIREWYCCQNTPALYLCDIELLKDNGERKLIFYKEEDHVWKSVNDHFTFSKIIENEEQNKWFKYEHEFKNYGKGLRKIKYIHGGRENYRIGEDIHVHGDYGSKMARACVKVDVPSLDYNFIVNLPNYY